MLWFWSLSTDGYRNVMVVGLVCGSEIYRSTYLDFRHVLCTQYVCLICNFDQVDYVQSTAETS